MLLTVNINEMTMSTTFPFFQPISGFPNEGYGDFCLNNTRTTTNTNEYFTGNSEQELPLNGIADFSEQIKQNWFCSRLTKPKQNKTNKKAPKQPQLVVNPKGVEGRFSQKSISCKELSITQWQSSVVLHVYLKGLSHKWSKFGLWDLWYCTALRNVEAKIFT